MLASAPVSSPSRRAALPVGAHSLTLRFCARSRSTSARIVCVLPVPGRPVRIERRCSTRVRDRLPLGVGRDEGAARSGARTRRPRGGAAPAATPRARARCAQPPLDRVHHRVEDAAVLVDELPGGGERRRGGPRVGAEQPPRALEQLAARQVAVAVALGLVQRVDAGRRRSATGASGGVPSARASASAVAKPMPSTSVVAYGSVCSISMQPGPSAR